MSEQERDPNAEELQDQMATDVTTQSGRGDDEGVGHGDEPIVDADADVGEELHIDRYESAWMRASAIILVIFFVAVTVSAFVSGFQVPGVYARVDPATLYDADSPWAEPGLRELAPGRYEAYVRAQIWQFTPNEIRVPVGSHVTFYITSQDVQHGFKLTDSNVNIMVLPGQVSKVSMTFENPGEYNYICHEYCGQLHHTMFGRVIVEQPAEETATALAD